MPQRFIVDRVREALEREFPELTPEQLDHLAEEQATMIADRVIYHDGEATDFIDLPASLIDHFLSTKVGGWIGRLFNRYPQYRRIPVRIDWSKIND